MEFVLNGVVYTVPLFVIVLVIRLIAQATNR